MPIAISSQMNASLVALTKTNEDVAQTQNRLATGLAVATASDNISVYFKAKTYADKADALDTTNKGITQAIANLDVVDKALSNMQESLKGALQLMQSARSQPLAVQRAATTKGDQAYATTTIGGIAHKGDIVQTAASKADSSAYFQIGDVFAITLADSSSSTGGKVTKYFRATNPAVALPANAVNELGQPVDASGNVVSAASAADANGSTYNQAMNFNDLESLGNVIQQAFGLDTLSTSLTSTGSGAATTYQLGFALNSLSTSLTFTQVNDQAVGATADPGAAVDFQAIFGKLQNAANTAYATAASTTTDSLTYKVKTISTTTSGGQVFGATGGAATNANVALQTRKDAANFFRQTLLGLDNMAKDASLPGYNNLLKGETLNVGLNDAGTTTQVVKLTQAADPLSLGFSRYSVSSAGQVETQYTGGDFNVDSNIDASITQSNTALALLKQMQTILAAANVAMKSRLEYNKTMTTALTTGATEMTAADSTQEAANLAALQNRQSFAVNNMTITRQAEQSLIQLLR